MSFGAQNSSAEGSSLIPALSHIGLNNVILIASDDGLMSILVLLHLSTLLDNIHCEKQAF